ERTVRMARGPRREGREMPPPTGPAVMVDAEGPEDAPSANGLPQEAASTRWNEIGRAACTTLGINQRLSGWRLWPHDDFPRTHTFKVKRNEVRAWVGGTQPAPTAEAATTQDRTAEEVAAR